MMDYYRSAAANDLILSDKSIIFSIVEGVLSK